MELPALLHSVSYSGSWGQVFLTPEEFVDKAAELGYQGVMLMAKRPHLSILDSGAADRAALRARIERRGMTHVCIAGYNNFTGDLEHGEVPHREIQVHYIMELAKLARDLGGNLVRVFTGYENAAASFTAQWNLIVTALKEAAKRAADLDVTIGVQNHHDIAVGYESMRDLIEAVAEPNCKALFDAWAPALQGVDLSAAARRMGDITTHTTIANYQKRPRYRYNAAVVNYEELTPYAQAVPIDDGFIDYSDFLSAMRANGFRGSVAYEMCSPVLGGGSIENLDRYARRFVEFLSAFRAGASAAAAD
jgi:sugar phosphate isomerase/epimerase